MPDVNPDPIPADNGGTPGRDERLESTASAQFHPSV
jgi:hypothetical protein